MKDKEKALKQLIDSIPPDWKEIFLKDSESYNMLRTILQEIQSDLDDICPNIENIFRAFRITPANRVRVVIIGQDPYHTPEVADGLCFSTRPGNSIPPSLRNIYLALMNSGMVDEKPQHACLQNWGAQGVLMINSALTTVTGTAGKHTKIWKPWTNWLIKYLSDNYDELVFLLWGAKAQAVGQVVDIEKHNVLEWLHPSPMSQGVPEHLQFKSCWHFEMTSEWYQDKFGKKLDWNPSQTTYVYTDGACKGNGQHKAKAGYGVYFQCGPLRGTQIYAPLPKAEYNGIKMKQTNNRAEMLATIDALETYMEYGCVGNLFLVVDSDFVRKIIVEWIDMWYSRNKIDQMKNADLVWRLKDVLDRIYAFQRSLDLKFKIIHVYSHIPKKKAPAEGTKDYKMWKGNNIADDLSNKGVIASSRIIEFA